MINLLSRPGSKPKKAAAPAKAATAAAPAAPSRVYAAPGISQEATSEALRRYLNGEIDVPWLALGVGHRPPRVKGALYFLDGPCFASSPDILHPD